MYDQLIMNARRSEKAIGNRKMPKLLQLVLSWTLRKESIYGAYTEGFAGSSLECGQRGGGGDGACVIPWGRFYDGLRKGIGVGDGSGGGGRVGRELRRASGGGVKSRWRFSFTLIAAAVF